MEVGPSIGLLVEDWLGAQPCGKAPLSGATALTVHSSNEEPLADVHKYGQTGLIIFVF